MDWWLVLIIIFGSLTALLLLGIPVGFAFLLVNAIGVYMFWGGLTGLQHLILSMSGSVTNFNLLAVVFFVLMGEALFQSGIGSLMIGAVDKMMGNLRGRLSLVAVAAGTLFATMSGSTMASVALLGSVLVPEMEKRGYGKSMSLGPILGSGGLAMMIPPSALAVVLASLAYISIGKLLIAIIVPGLLLAVLYAAYVLARAYLQPSLTPAYQIARISFAKKLEAFLKYVLPLSFLIFLVLGLIFLGVATPTESAVMGGFGAFIMSAFYGKLSRKVIRTSFYRTVHTVVMIFFIIMGAKAFSQILAFSGASRGLVQYVVDLPMAPIFILLGIQVVLLILGCFMEITTIMMVTIPIFLPIIEALKFDPVWFAVIYLINMEMATITPPFGLNLFVMKDVASGDTTMGDCVRAALPFVGLDIIGMGLVIIFPAFALWLPAVMK